MSKLKHIEIRVMELLENYQECRENDHKLYAMYIQIYHFIEFTVETFIKYKEYGIPSFESVSRCRRKLQEKNITLKPSNNILEDKEYAKIEYIKYAIEGD